MATGKGVIQGYTGLAAVDAAHQIIVEAQAHGTGSEQELLIPVVSAMQRMLTATSLITADAGYHSDANVRQLAAMSVDALIADNDMRRRDERFATQHHHKAAPDPLHDKAHPAPVQTVAVFPASAFRYDAEARTCICPAGKMLNRNGGQSVKSRQDLDALSGEAARLRPVCAARTVSRDGQRTTAVRSVMFFPGQDRPAPETHHRADETPHRSARRSHSIRPALWNRGTRVRESVLQQRARSLHAPRPERK